MLQTFENLIMSDDEEKTIAGNCPFDLSAGKQLIFIYINIISILINNAWKTVAPAK